MTAGHVPRGAGRNRDYLADRVDFDGQITDEARTILVDPQTSGGLLLAVSQERLRDLLGALGARGVRGTAVGSSSRSPWGGSAC